MRSFSSTGGTTRPTYKEMTVDKHVCKQQNVTIDHIVSICSLLAPTDDLYRHDRAAKYIRWVICKNLDLPRDKKKTGGNTNHLSSQSSRTSPFKLTGRLI
uniref:Uncharacterized protein n=1 Tax=Octopus bimaculoides TaxID=37653 RepID=A0A0L8HA34_OCTBM